MIYENASEYNYYGYTPEKRLVRYELEARGLLTVFSSEVGTSSREENASKNKSSTG